MKNLNQQSLFPLEPVIRYYAYYRSWNDNGITTSLRKWHREVFFSQAKITPHFGVFRTGQAAQQWIELHAPIKRKKLVRKTASQRPFVSVNRLF
jgi:hypothetical protein